MNNLRDILEKINTNPHFRGSVLLNEPMKLHTSFKIGGPADIFLIPETAEDIIFLTNLCNDLSLPYFILGAGANILVSDKGIRGIVISLDRFRGVSLQNLYSNGPLSSAQNHPSTEDHSFVYIQALAGTPISDVSQAALKEGLTGLEFIYSMPGSTGGAVWMNARCYGKSVSDVLFAVEYLDTSKNQTELKQEIVNKEQFGYKLSPFQGKKDLILSATFRLSKGNQKSIKKEMERIKSDRETKGHFLYPCAGSVFKNNRAFGMPTGKIIEKTGLKGYKIGGAQIAPFHANIIINTGKASATDVLKLVELIEEKVFNRFGFELEREIIPVGEW